jgi:hypothetical protein
MTEQRCPACEALIVELDCLECVAHEIHETAVNAMEKRLQDIPPPTRSHCAKGHEMTEENTRIEIRVDGKQSITRICKQCHQDRAVAQRERGKTRPRERAERSTGAGPRQPGG